MNNRTNRHNADVGTRCFIASAGTNHVRCDATHLRELALILVKWQHAELAKRHRKTGRAA